MAGIVLGYDASPGAERAFETAIELARQYGCRLVIANGVAPGGASVGDEWQEARKAVEEQARAHVEGALERARAAGIAAEIALVPERPHKALLDLASMMNASFIVVGSWGESPMRGAILGSTPHKLLHLSETPVVVVPA
jgi:nucleotide-binding universal stress UspA family protein